ncbi:zinc-binding dehydrogenase [Burkholderia sp. Ac-20353]|uniref:zinc-binding dehydrogenase n=1 Tax=Burkholderia sp. Ac-20353 TaxID=2703894 RepID=UPI00197C7098|nr:zinc-binding dehydrogenase [Burkholderia sp. Ac-20353]MBN3785375.1 zinc-binding dehydrogenase [Burkholderia sp. Ac-20353]
MKHTTYRAMQIVRPGALELVERTIPEPGNGEVLIAVDACGVCGADGRDIEHPVPGAPLPRVPGHEVVGRIVALGANCAPMWQIGQRVGVGRLGGPCLVCPACRQGHFTQCHDQPVVGATCDGGYADLMLARSTGLVSIPDELSAEEAAPILCAGIATFNALRKCGAEAGDVVAILGIGGLGHMAVQYARRMGFRVVAIGRGDDIADTARQLGAHRYVDTRHEDVSDALKRLGGARAIVTTIADPETAARALNGLAPQGRLIVLGAGKDPLPVSMSQLVGGERCVLGSLTGSPYETEKALDFSVLTGVRPMIEVMPLERANDAYQRMRSGDANFRMVLSIPRDAA